MPAVTVRPNATVSAPAGWPTTAGAPLHSVLNDNLDSTLSTAAVAFTSAILSFPTPAASLPAGAVIKSLQVFLRAAKGNGAGVAGMNVWVGYSPPGQPFQNIYDTTFSYPTTVQTNASSQPFAPSLAGRTSQQLIDNLDLGLQITDFASNGTVNLFDTWLIYVYALKPTAAITSPAAAAVLSSSTPTVKWAHTPGTDGGPQTRAQVAIASSAQYGVGGFDPETSTVTDRATIEGSGTTYTPTQPLTTGLTYRIYVRTAQSVNGIDQWSDWVNVQVTTSFTVTTISSIVATPNSTSTGWHSVVVTRNGATPAWDWVELERSDDGGATWVPVRGAHQVTATNAFVTAWSTSAITVLDHESPNGVVPQYRARAMNDAPGSEVVGPWTAATAAVGAWSSLDIILKSPLHPSLNRIVQFEDQQPELTDDISQAVLWPTATESGDPVTPVVITDVYQASTGDLALEEYTTAASNLLRALLNDRLLLLQYPPVAPFDGASAYIVLGPRRRVHKSTASEWVAWRMSFVIVDRFADDVTP